MASRFGWVIALGIGVAAGTGLGVGIERARRDREDTPVATAQIFADVLSAIRKDFVDSLSDAELYAKAARGVVTTLGDPYSTLLTPEEYRRYRETLDGNGLVLGLAVADGPTGLRVASVIPDSPADRAGIEPGDYVLGLGDQSTQSWNAAKAASFLRPSVGRELAIRIRPPGDTVPVALTLEPTEVDIPAVQAALRLTDSVGYLSLRSISSHSSRTLRRALDDLRASRLTGLVIDLRGNPGGRLDEGLAIADLFLEPGQRIGTVSKRGIFARTYEAAHGQPYPGLRLALLVDGKTASSAEIIAAALRDHRRAVLVGERTFGKGLIQTTIPLGDSLAIRLSTGRWEGPGGTTIVGGLAPDTVVRAEPTNDRLTRLVGADGDLVARQLEVMVREARNQGIRSADSATFGPASAEQLRILLRQNGFRLERGQLEAHLPALELEFRRIFALIDDDREAAQRLVLQTDPVVSAALAKLGATEETPTAPPPADTSAGR